LQKRPCVWQTGNLNLISNIALHDILNNTTIIDSNLIMIQSRGMPSESTGFLDKIRTASIAIQSQINFSRVYKDLGFTEVRWQDVHWIHSGVEIPKNVR
jgi:hypothetical protein